MGGGIIFLGERVKDVGISSEKATKRDVWLLFISSLLTVDYLVDN